MDRSPYSIAKARPRDIAPLAAIELAAAALLDGHVPDSVLHETTDEDDFVAAQAEGRLWVALVDDIPVGFALVEMLGDGLAHLEEIDVDPQHGRRGLGAALVRAVCEWATQCGYAEVTLTTFRNLPFNMPFYARLGLRSRGARAAESRTCGGGARRDRARLGSDPTGGYETPDALTVKLTPQDLQDLADRTLAHYDQQAEDFWNGTRDHDVSQNIAALLQYIESQPPFTILDLGCGPGRDLKAFRDLGHIAIGLEGAARFVAMARARSGCEVWQQDFLKLDLPDDHFDGVFANAALFHVPGQELPRVLEELRATLKPGGVLFSSNPRGRNEEGWNRGRYGAYHDLETWRRYLSATGFVELTHYYRPAGLPCAQQPWLASVWRRPAA